MTNAELKAEWARAIKDRDEAVRDMQGLWGEPPGLETQLRIALNDARMASFFLHKLIERLPDESTASTSEASPNA